MNSIDDQNLKRAAELFDSVLVPAADAIRERNGRTLPDPPAEAASFWVRHAEGPLLRPAGDQTVGEALATLWEKLGFDELVAVAAALDGIVTDFAGPSDEDGPSPYIYAMF